VTEAGKDPVITNYVHDGIHVIAEYNGEGELLKEYVYSDNIDEVLSSKTVIPDSDPKYSITNYYHQDGLNSVVAVTDADGERVASYNYEAFGTIKDATGALDNPITYTGRWFEPETGDYFYRARYYDSGVGRFLKRDPIGFDSQDYNLFRYVGNSSINVNDPYGLNGLLPDFFPLIPPIIGPNENASSLNKKKGKWSCTAKCQGRPTKEGNCCPDWLHGGPAYGKTEGEACRAAKRMAQHSAPVGCYGRHCSCKCAKG
jgi:RHS repeat-associated protein